MAKNFSNASHRDNLCAASQKLLHSAPSWHCGFCHFPFQYLPENYTGNGRGGSE